MTEKALPTVGDDIYVPTALYMSHGQDDRLGGLATVLQAEHKYGTYMVEVEAFPGTWFNWEFLAQEQDELRRRFGTERARSVPDEREEFNAGAAITHDVIRRWLNEGKKRGATHVIVEYDAFDHSNFPHYVMPGENVRAEAAKLAGVEEVYSLARDLEPQLAQFRCFSWD